MRVLLKKSSVKWLSGCKLCSGYIFLVTLKEVFETVAGSLNLLLTKLLTVYFLPNFAFNLKKSIDINR